MKRREEYIDIYRGIAVMFMVFGHVQLGAGYGSGNCSRVG